VGASELLHGVGTELGLIAGAAYRLGWTVCVGNHLPLTAETDAADLVEHVATTLTELDERDSARIRVRAVRAALTVLAAQTRIADYETLRSVVDALDA
jgi:hypothetical protein